MTALNYLRRRIGRTLLLFQSQSSREAVRLFTRNESSFVPKRILVMSKLSQYHFEKLREPHLNETELKSKLLERGTDYEDLLDSHHANKNILNQVTQTLRSLNMEYRVVDRTNIERASFDWADFILPIGGDGTFLLSANFIHDNKKPIMGINSQPGKSEGFLMLPAKYTKNIRDIFDMLKSGDYSILMRRRIRTVLKGEGIWDQPFHMHEKGRLVGKRWLSQEDEPTSNKNLPKQRRLPWLALNEVFMGECLSAKTSSLHIQLDEEENVHRVKCSGICVSTGTGSTSWHKTINRLSTQTIRNILKIVDSNRTFNEEDILRIQETYNNGLRFDPESERLCYAIRDMIVTNHWPIPKSVQPRNFCQKLTVQSQCYDAGLVLDGGIAVPFNVGTTAVLETYPQDSLRNIVLP